MARFGRKSRTNLLTCDDRLQEVFNEVIKYVDCSVLEGHRSEERQDNLYDKGRSKVKYPNGRITLRWGGDWDMDFQVKDNGFDDFPHFELRDVSDNN